jgi:hypothetical protein
MDKSLTQQDPKNLFFMQIFATYWQKVAQYFSNRAPRPEPHLLPGLSPLVKNL